MGAWVALLGQKKTDEELSVMRTEAAKYFDDIKGYQFDGFSCDTCGARHTCDYVFDIYNTDGDCLAEK